MQGTTVRERVPSWIKVRLPGEGAFPLVRQALRERGLHTVCEEARCPNLGECWGEGTATLMLLGDTCTRGCRFCAVKTSRSPPPPDPDEPTKVSQTVSILGLSYVVLTSVDRDDLPDQGSGHIARTIEVLRKEHPGLLVEVLTPDFRGDERAIETVVRARPDVFAHNLETVRRLTPHVRDPRATYDQSLHVLRTVKRMDPTIWTKSSLMLGLGETEEEVLDSLADLRSVGVDFVTLGQYLRPTLRHLPVQSYVPPETFEAFRESAEAMGFLYVASGPLVRSSYRAGEFFLQSLLRKTNGEGKGVRHEG